MYIHMNKMLYSSACMHVNAHAHTHTHTHTHSHVHTHTHIHTHTHTHTHKPDGMLGPHLLKMTNVVFMPVSFIHPFKVIPKVTVKQHQWQF